MAAIVNDRDVLLQAASVRKLTTAGVAVVPTPSSYNFYLRADGSHGPDYVRISVATIMCDGPFTFAVQGAKLSNITATTADIAYADMTSALAIVTVTAANAGTPVQGSCIIGLVSDGQSGQPGTRGAGVYYATGGSWSDTVAKAACPSGVAIAGDVVTISNGATYALTKKYDGSAWAALGGVYDGSLFVTGSIQAAAINTNGLTVRDLQGNIIIGVGSALNPNYAAAGTLNSAISVNTDGSLNNAGGGKVTLPGIGQDTYRIFTKSNTATNAPGEPVGLYKNGSIIHGVQRSYSLVVIQRSSGSITWQKDYDVYGAGEIGGAKAYDLALDLNNLADAAGQYIVIVYTFDEPRNRREESGLMQAMYRNGASRGVFGSSQFQSWSAYALVGISGCGEGNGAEAYQGAVSGDPNAWIDVSFGVVAGNLTGVTLNYVPKTLQDYGYVGDMNATSGAPSGTAVGGTEAGLLAARALNGDAAYNAINNASTGLASKMAANARNILAGGAGLAAGSITWDGNGNYAGGAGVAINSRGIVAYNTNNENTFFLNGSDGTAGFKGAVYAQSGYIGGMNLYSGALCTGGYTGWAWPGQDANGNWLMGGYFGPTGILLGNANANKYFQATYDGNVYAPGFKLENGQLTLTSSIIVSPNISGASFDSFAASLSGSAGGSFANTSGNVGYGTLTASPSGGRAPYTYQWTLTESSRTNTAYRMNVAGSTTGQSLSLVGFGSNCTNEYRVTCIVTDANGRTATIGRSVTANHGTPP